jgi:hypothetical protein
MRDNMRAHRENTITFVEYTVNDSGLSFEELNRCAVVVANPFIGKNNVTFPFIQF